jgi:Kef-type K+ transport system membrane component KefB
MFFQLSTLALAGVIVLIVGGSVAAGILIGRRIRSRSEAHRATIAVIQGTLLSLVGLLLAFGLTMAVGRYEGRRALVLKESNDIGTTFLRAQMLAEPERTASLEILELYADAAIDLADQVPDTARFLDDVTRISDLQRQLWALAGDVVREDPVGTAPRLYIETLNEMIDTHNARVSSLRNRVPSTVVLLQVAGSAIALGVLSLYLALLGRSVITSIAAATFVILILFISFDLDRPQRGLITVPFAPLVHVRASMELPPAATGR